MTKSRMEAFSDGVIAIVITIMVLEMKVPHDPEPGALRSMLPVFLSYVMSFIYLGIYWNNHHHMLQAVHRVTGSVLWANLHLLFWLTLVPFATGWMGENEFAAGPVAIYGVVLLMAAIAYYILTRRLIACHPGDSTLKRAVGSDVKGRLSVVLYVVAAALAFVRPWVACAIYVLVAAIWLVPDRRIEKALQES